MSPKPKIQKLKKALIAKKHNLTKLQLMDTKLDMVMKNLARLEKLKNQKARRKTAKKHS